MKPHAILPILIIACGATLSLAQTTGTHTWTSSDGKVIQAKFIKLDGEAVVIEMDRQQHVVPFARLKAESVALAKKLGGLAVSPASPETEESNKPSGKGAGTLEAPAPPPPEASPASEQAAAAPPADWDPKQAAGKKRQYKGDKLLLDGGVIAPSGQFSGNKGQVFTAVATREDGSNAWEVSIPELKQMNSQSITAGNQLVCFAGENKDDGSLLLRAYDLKDGKPLWQKDGLLPKAARVSKANYRDYYDIVLLSDSHGSVFLGWTQPKDGEFKPYLAKFSAQGETLWVRQLAQRTAPISAGLKYDTLILDGEGNPVFIYEQAESGSAPEADGTLLADTSIKKREVWTIAKFSGTDGQPLWQYARKGIVDEEEWTGYASKLTTDAEGNVVFLWKLHRSKESTGMKLSAKEGKVLWEGKSSPN